MKLIPQDIELLEQAREHIDTVLIPLAPVDLGQDAMNLAKMNEFLSILSSEIERQFKGRIILVPPLSYLAGAQGQEKSHIAGRWEKAFLQQGFRHIFFLTCDPVWKAVEADLTSELVWVPSLQLGGLDDQVKRQLMDEQVRQVSSIFSQKWI
ncbi:YpiF family protein [Peribacillus sp. SCS-37]|uniref:YpiF family protein n=1 Tax=Paraperibacillus esterisolvens TaxID=3115296 RepID=UPI00390667C9